MNFTHWSSVCLLSLHSANPISVPNNGQQLSEDNLFFFTSMSLTFTGFYILKLFLYGPMLRPFHWHHRCFPFQLFFLSENLLWKITAILYILNLSSSSSFVWEELSSNVGQSLATQMNLVFYNVLTLLLQLSDWILFFFCFCFLK